MGDLLTLNGLFTLIMLMLLQAVLGFDNLLYISLESKRAPLDKQAAVRRWGIGIAIVARLVLLVVLMGIVESFQEPMFSLDNAVIHGAFNIESLIVLLGGTFIMYTATKEIWHMLGLEEIDHRPRPPRSVTSVVAWIVVMNLVFSFDSILSAMALSESPFIIGTAIVVGGLLMIVLSDQVSRFLQKNRMYEVLGLFILFIVGIMLLTEGGHKAHLRLFGHDIMPMSKATFYFVIAVLVLTDLVQGRYQRKLTRLKRSQKQQPA